MRPAFLDEFPERLDEFAMLLATGKTRKEIANYFDISVESVSAWRKRPDVRARVGALIKERANRIFIHTDSAIEKRLERDRDTIAMRDLLEIRRSFAPDAPTADTTPEAVQEFLEQMHSDPDFAEQVSEALKDDDPAD